MQAWAIRTRHNEEALRMKLVDQILAPGDRITREESPRHDTDAVVGIGKQCGVDQDLQGPAAKSRSKRQSHLASQSYVCARAVTH
jgi:hypothetical protein